jgi:hypothetical protein
LTVYQLLRSSHLQVGGCTKSRRDTSMKKWRRKMKTLVTKMALLTLVAAAPLLSTEAAYAQRYRQAPSAYDTVNHSDHRSWAHDQQTIDEITNNDWSAGK